MYTLRPMMPDDRAFIHSSWLKGARFGNPYFEQIPATAFYTSYGPIVETKLELGTTLIACLTDDPEVILGFANGRPGIIDWVYVKPAFRKQGIAKSLASNFDVHTVTGWSKPGAAITKKKELTFNPFT